MPKTGRARVLTSSECLQVMKEKEEKKRQVAMEKEKRKKDREIKKKGRKNRRERHLKRLAKQQNEKQKRLGRKEKELKGQERRLKRHGKALLKLERKGVHLTVVKRTTCVLNENDERMTWTPASTLTNAVYVWACILKTWTQTDSGWNAVVDDGYTKTVWMLRTLTIVGGVCVHFVNEFHKIDTLKKLTGKGL